MSRPPLPTFPRSLEQFYVRIIGFILNDQGEFGFEVRLRTADVRGPAGTRRLVYDAVAVVSAVRVRPSTSVKTVGASRFEAAMRILYWLPVVRPLMV